jgi:tetratricopeptide (TPR) repeat protein
VELSLRRLSEASQERVKVLSVFHGGVNLEFLTRMTGWPHENVEQLARELVGTGLATPRPCNYVALNPSLCAYLKQNLKTDEFNTYLAHWLNEMPMHVAHIYELNTKDLPLASLLTQAELPNLLAFLNFAEKNFQDNHEANHALIDLASFLYNLIQFLGKPHILQLVGRVRDSACGSLGETWSQAHFSAIRAHIEQLLDEGKVQEALEEAQHLLSQARAAGTNAYQFAAEDLANACWLTSHILRTSGHADQALLLAQEASQRVTAIADKKDANRGLTRMANRFLIEQGLCHSALGQFDAATKLYIECIRLSEVEDDQQILAGAKAALGNHYSKVGRFNEALDLLAEARMAFSSFDDQVNTANVLSMMGSLYAKKGQVEEAEEAFNQALAIWTQLKNQAQQASTLDSLGILYNDFHNQHEVAAKLFRRAVAIYAELGDAYHRGLSCFHLSSALRKLRLLNEARHAAELASNFLKPYGHNGNPWEVSARLFEIETDSGNTAAASEARRQAIAAFLAYRRNGGENKKPYTRILLAVNNALSDDNPAAALSLLQMLIPRTSSYNLNLLLGILMKITTGSRDPSLAENPGLSYDQSVEVLLLIEKLGKVSTTLNSQPGLARTNHKFLEKISLFLAYILPWRANSRRKNRL